jgi:thioredoxin:protein disulfide reductase
MGLVMGLIAAPCTGPFLTGILTVIAKERQVALGGAALFAFSLGLGVLFFLAGAFAMKLPKGGAWMMGIKWVSGVGLAYMAFAYLRDRFDAVRSLVAHPSTTFGAVAGGLLLVGFVLGIVHILAERRKSPIAHLSKPMKLASILPAVVGIVMFATWVSLPRGGAMNGSAPDIAWMSDEVDGRAKASAENKPVIIDFGAEWCPVCKKLEHNTFPDPAVRSEAQRFVAIRVDATDDEATAAVQKKYGVIGLPTVVLFDSAGNEIARFNDEVPPAKLAEAMKKVPASSGAVGMR